MAAVAESFSPEKTVFAFDTFSGMPNVSEFDEHKAGDFGDIDFEEIKTTTSQLPNIKLVRGPHEATVPSFSRRPISLLFLDSDLYESHLVALRHFWPDISQGGQIVLHDWNTQDCPGVKKAILEFFGPSPTNHFFLEGMLTVQKQDFVPACLPH